MKLIDRYVYAVTEHLPVDTREDISRELRANIEDMLTDDATKEEVREVIEKLGNPKKLASEYSGAKRYLIGPELYDDFLSVLKLVVVIVASVVGGIALLEGVISSTPDQGIMGNSIGIMVKVFTGALGGAIQGGLWVILVFAILERTGVNRVGFRSGKVSLGKDKWSIDELPEITEITKGRISRGESLFSMIFTVIFTSVVYFNVNLIGYYTKSQGRIVLAAPLFSEDRLKLYMPLFLAIALFQFSVYTWKFIVRKWSIPLAVTNTICNIAVSVLMYVMISDVKLFNQGLVRKISDSIGVSAPQLPQIWSASTKVFIVVFVLICIWDSISGFLKSRK